jgi:hypothetical protein
MPSKKQLTGMRGVYLVSAGLSCLGFIASPTSRSAIGADVLVADQACQPGFSSDAQSPIFSMTVRWPLDMAPDRTVTGLPLSSVS